MTVPSSRSTASVWAAPAPPPTTSKSAISSPSAPARPRLPQHAGLPVSGPLFS